MKKTCFLSFVLICVILALIGCSNTANSNDFKIDKKDIDNRLLYNKINNLVNKEYLKKVFADDFETQYQSVILSEKEEEIENSIIEDTVIIKYCKEKGILIDKDSSVQAAKIEFDNLTKDDSQNRYTSILKNVLTEYKLSEDEYLNLVYEEAYYKYNRQAFKKYFYENSYEENNNKTLEEQLSDYIETVLK